MYLFIKSNERILKILLAHYGQWAAQNRKCNFSDEISFYAPKNADHKKQFAGKYEASD
jgi:hypothetical protein